MRELGQEVRIPRSVGRGSSDFGDFSQTIPGIHPSFGIKPACETELPGHSVKFRESAATKEGFDNAMNAAASMAAVAWKYLTDGAFRAAVREDFERRGR